MHGVFLDIDTVDRGDIDLSGLRASLPEWTFLATGEGDVGELTLRADILVSNKIVLDADTIRNAKNLKLICIAATGTNNVDLVAAAEKGIPVCNVRGYATPSAVEHVFSLILCLSRSIRAHLDAMDHGKWQEADTFCMLDYPIREIAGSTLGIIGFGEIGRAVAAVGEAFGMRVLIAERKGATLRQGRTHFHEVLSRSDIISMHCPLTDDTRNLIGSAELLRMKRDAILINIARGGIVNETDLSDALKFGTIGGAAVDVLCEEPPRAGSPLLSRPHPNLIVTPHVAWASRNSRQRLVDAIAANIRAYLSGTPCNVINN